MFRTITAILTGLLLVATFALPAQIQAQGVKNFAVLPFDYIGPEKYQHYGKSVRSVLKSKLNTPGVFEPASESQAALLGETAPDSSATAVSLLNAADIDYLIYGMISVAGDTAGIEINAQGKTGNLIKKTSEVPHDQLSLELNKLSSQITKELFNTASAEASAPATGGGSANPTFLNAEPTETSNQSQSINPEFRYEGGAENTGRKQSQGLRFPSRGMAVCDGDGDGKNEVFILGDSKLMAYSFENDRLVLLGEMRFANRLDPLSISSIDSNKDGRAELVVTTFFNNPLSFVYEYASGKFSPVVERSQYFLNVVRMPPNYSPTLTAQRLSTLGGLRSTDAVEAYISKGDIVTGRSIPLPQFANIYNIAYLPQENSYKLLVLDAYNRLKVYTDQMEADSYTEEAYNSATVPIGLGSAVVAGMQSSRDAMEESYYYIPMAMQVTNMFTDGNKYEVLLNKDVSIASQIFTRFKSFTQGEIHSMFWDGTGMSLSWKTRRIKGTVISYDIVDVDNDGQKELAVLVNTYPGAVAMANIKTVLLVYELDL